VAAVARKLPFIAAAIASLALAPGAHAEARSLERISVGPQAGTNGPYVAEYRDSTADGSRIVLSTPEPLVAADVDNTWDLYMRAGGTTTLISAGTQDNEQADYDAMSGDGSRVIFSTAESLDSADTDAAVDLYEWHSGTITLLSDGVGADQPQNVQFEGATPDATHVYFSTNEAITGPEAGEPTARNDIFERSRSTTTRVSVGLPGHDTSEGVSQLYGVSPDGSRAYWGTSQTLDPSDQDNHSEDIFLTTGGTTTMLTDVTATGSDWQDHVHFDALSADGTRIAFTTGDAMSADDTDSDRDVYVTDGESDPQLVTTDTPDEAAFNAANPGLTRFAYTAGDDIDVRDLGDPASTVATPGTGEPVYFEDASKDLSRIFFGTQEALTSDDHDSAGYDVYEQHGSSRSLVTSGPTDPEDADQGISWVSDDGTRVFWESDSSMTGDDTDGGLPDVYEWSAGASQLLSPGSDANEAYLSGITPDGASAFIETGDPLTSGDSDGDVDVFASRVDPPSAPAGSDGSGEVPHDNPRPLPGPPADLKAPLLKLAKSGKQRVLKQGGVVVTLSVDESSTASVTGSVGSARLKPAKRLLKAGTAAKLKLALPKAARKKLAKQLKRGKKLTARVTVIVTDAAGNRTAKKLAIALRA
jgi:hypothetical protein